MTSSVFRTGLACSIGLSLLAGCAAPPIATAPAATGTAPVETASAPAAQGEAAAPAMPAPAAQAPTQLTGTATFRGEPLAGYAVSVFDARTGQPVELRDDLSGATGLAILNRGLETDAAGAFTLHVVGLQEGEALHVVATKGAARLEAVVTSNMQSLGAKGYSLAQAGTRFTLSELTTAIARIARGVLTASSVLPRAAAAPVINQLADRMADLSERLGAELARNPSSANALVAAEGDQVTRTLVANAGQLQPLTQAMAALLGEIARGAQGATIDAQTRARLERIELVGTVLGASFANGAFTLTNGINGRSVEATAADFGAVTSQVTRPSSGSSGPKQEPATLVSTSDELHAALKDPTIAVIRLANDLTVEPEPGIPEYRVLLVQPVVLGIERPVTIDGDGKTLSGFFVEMKSGGITLKNMQLAALASIPQNLAALDGAITLDGVTFTGELGMHLSVASGCTLNVKNCHFDARVNNAISVASNTGCTLNVSNSTFNRHGVAISVGVSVEDATAKVSIAGCRFNNLTSAGITSRAPITLTGSQFSGVNVGYVANNDDDLLRVTNNTFNVIPAPSSSLAILKIYGALDGVKEKLLSLGNTFPGYDGDRPVVEAGDR